jgi:hypothetical protein
MVDKRHICQQKRLTNEAPKSTIHFKNFTCDICSRKYSSAKSLYNHRRIKHNTLFINDVNEELKYKCNYCNKEFKHRQSKSRQEKICDNMKIYELNKEIVEVKKELKKTKAKRKKIKTINNINNFNIIVNNFSSDNTSYISDKFKENMLKYFENNNYHIPIPKIVQNLKFNPNHKENNNMKITNMKSDIGQKYENNKWIHCKKKDMLNEAHKIAVLLVEGWINENNKNISEDAITGFQEYLNKNKTSIKKTIFDEINKLGYFYYKNNMEIDLDN